MAATWGWPAAFAAFSLAGVVWALVSPLPFCNLSFDHESCLQFNVIGAYRITIYHYLYDHHYLYIITYMITNAYTYTITMDVMGDT
jgi:hypothetical protein